MANPIEHGQSTAEQNAAAASFARLIHKLDYLSPTDLKQVRLAYRFADQAHLGQLRNSGEPYITHPIAVAVQCAEWKLDAQAMMAALLHDALEDCDILLVLVDHDIFRAVPLAERASKLVYDTRGIWQDQPKPAVAGEAATGLRLAS